MPEVVGVPLIVMLFAVQLPVTPGGKPVKVAPVALVVLYVIFVMAVLIHFVCMLDPAAEVNTEVLVGVTMTVETLVVSFPQDPVATA